jgi:hypothetical protein
MAHHHHLLEKWTVLDGKNNEKAHRVPSIPAIATPIVLGFGGRGLGDSWDRPEELSAPNGLVIESGENGAIWAIGVILVLLPVVNFSFLIFIHKSKNGIEEKTARS